MYTMPPAIIETAHIPSGSPCDAQFASIPTPVVGSITVETGLIRDLYPLPVGFVYLDEAIPGMLWDAKYATTDNFTGKIVDGYEANRIALTRQVANGLITAQALAREEGLQLLVWDAARPQRAVDCFVRWSEAPEDDLTRTRHYPNLDKSQLFGEYIARRSGHSRGCAVDLTLVDETGAPLDMGGDFDLMDARSHHGARDVGKRQAANRKLLRRIMLDAGFDDYESEWWHYTVKDEPFPDRYFDFVIG
ncbi:MAG: M15 family metallopeptidase [Clostridia bacterium]